MFNYNKSLALNEHEEFFQHAISSIEEIKTPYSYFHDVPLKLLVITTGNLTHTAETLS